MIIGAHTSGRQVLLAASAVLILGCSSNKAPGKIQETDIKFSVVETKLEPPVGHRQKLCLTVKGDPGCEFGLSTVPGYDYQKARPFSPVGAARGNDRVKMPGSGQTTVCYDITEQPTGQQTYNMSVFPEAKSKERPGGEPLVGMNKKVEVTYSRPPYVKFKGVNMYFNGFQDTTWSMGYDRRGLMNLTLPPTTKITVDGTSTVTDKTDILVPLPLDKKVRALPLADLLGGGVKTVKIKVALTLPDGQVHQGDLELTVNKHLREWLDQKLKGVENGPIAFGDEPPPPASRSIYHRGKIIGPAKKVTDITHVVIRVDAVRKRPCGSFEVSAEDWIFKVYDRLKGKLTRTKVFGGKMPRCPKKKTDLSGSKPDQQEVSKWMEGLVN